jgi:mannosyl-oligosaccharide glucosidase
MAVTAFIKRLGRHAELTDLDLGLGFGAGSPQVAFAASQTSRGNRYLQDRDLALSFLQSIYSPLKRHYEWFRRTQRGQLKQYGRKARSRTEAYRWRGRSEKHVLTSGMDDYPRAPPHIGELHLDLLSWMGFFSRTMKEIAEFIGEEEDRLHYADNEKASIENLDGLGSMQSLLSLMVLTVVVEQTYIGAKIHRCIVTSEWMTTVRVHSWFPGQLDDKWSL